MIVTFVLLELDDEKKNNMYHHCDLFEIHHACAFKKIPKNTKIFQVNSNNFV